MLLLVLVCVSVLVILLSSEGFGHLFKTQEILRIGYLQKKRDDFLDEGHSTLYVGVLPGIIAGFPEDHFKFFLHYLLLKNGFLSISAQTQVE